MSIWAVIPARPPEEGKSRLAAVLGQKERAALSERFFRRTLDLAIGTIGPSRTLVVSRSERVLAIAREAGVMVVSEGASDRLNQALSLGAFIASHAGATGVLSLAGDLPFLTRADIRAMLAAGRDGKGVVIGTDRPGLGTNALLVQPAGAIAYRYGEGSFRQHQAGARRAGLAFRVIRRFGLAFDIDTPADLKEFQQRHQHG
jgi:2-phospho-L-lactate guanylyltransferase